MTHLSKTAPTNVVEGILQCHVNTQLCYFLKTFSLLFITCFHLKNDMTHLSKTAPTNVVEGILQCHVNSQLCYFLKTFSLLFITCFHLKNDKHQYKTKIIMQQVLRVSSSGTLILTMEVLCCSKILVMIYQTTWHYIPPKIAILI